MAESQDKLGTVKESSGEKAAKIEYEIPVEGSLGLLALGAVGYVAWRKRVEEERSKKTTENNKENGEEAS